jgi:3-aminobutyryl-CoA ammonia-lyase
MTEPAADPAADPRHGLTVTHRRYVGHPDAHYAGDLVDGAFTLGLFGDVATEVCIRTDGDEGLFVGYASVEFLAPVRAGDLIEATAEVIRVGTHSRELRFTATVYARSADQPEHPSAAVVLDPPVEVVRAVGTVVVPG